MMSKHKKHRRREKERQYMDDLNSNTIQEGNINGYNMINNMMQNQNNENNINATGNMGNYTNGSNNNMNGNSGNMINNMMNNMMNGNLSMQGNGIMGNNPLNWFMQNLAQNPLLQILTNLDFNLLSKLLVGNKKEKAPMESEKVEDKFTDILKNLNESDIGELVKNVDKEQVNSILNQLNLNTSNNKNEGHREKKEDEKANFEHIYEDNNNVKIGEKVYPSSKILNIVSIILSGEDMEFLDEIVEIYEKHYDDESEEEYEVDNTLEKVYEAKEKIDYIKEVDTFKESNENGEQDEVIHDTVIEDIEIE